MMKNSIVFAALLCLAAHGCSRSDACEQAWSAWEAADKSKLTHATDYTGVEQAALTLKYQIENAAKVDTINGTLPRLADELGELAKVGTALTTAIRKQDSESIKYHTHRYPNQSTNVITTANALSRECH